MLRPPLQPNPLSGTGAASGPRTGLDFLAIQRGRDKKPPLLSIYEYVQSTYIFPDVLLLRRLSPGPPCCVRVMPRLVRYSTRTRYMSLSLSSRLVHSPLTANSIIAIYLPVSPPARRTASHLPARGNDASLRGERKPYRHPMVPLSSSAAPSLVGIFETPTLCPPEPGIPSQHLFCPWPCAPRLVCVV